ncbi:MAG: hypothetical protein RL145_1639, partial [Pseudomonadota bacterium]
MKKAITSAFLGATLAAFGLAYTAQAQTATSAGVRQVPVKKLFPYYDLYLSL